MKKLIVAALLVFLIALSACSGNTKSSMEANGWTEIQSISYQIVYVSNYNEYKVEEFTATSQYELETKTEEITEEEYRSLDTLPTFPLPSTGEIPKYKSELSDQLSDCREWEFYYTVQENQNTKYIKSSCTGYKFYFIQVKFFDDGSLGLKYYENKKETYIRVSPLTYQITYFSD